MLCNIPKPSSNYLRFAFSTYPKTIRRTLIFLLLNNIALTLIPRLAFIFDVNLFCFHVVEVPDEAHWTTDDRHNASIFFITVNSAKS
jgi:hypothetical protein